MYKFEDNLPNTMRFSSKKREWVFYLTSKTSVSVSSDIQTREGEKNKQVTIEMKPLLKYFCLGLFV